METKDKEFETIKEEILAKEAPLENKFFLKRLRCLWTAYCINKNLSTMSWIYQEKIQTVWKLLTKNFTKISPEISYPRFKRFIEKYLI